jgi:hypothetical protein
MVFYFYIELLTVIYIPARLVNLLHGRLIIVIIVTVKWRQLLHSHVVFILIVDGKTKLYKTMDT